MRTSLPDTLQAGDTWAWDATVDDYPSAEWTLKFVLHLRGSASTIDINAAAAAEGGNNYDVTVPANLTADYAPGAYDWMAFVEKGAGATRERYTVSGVGGTVRIVPDLETATTTTDTRTHARKMLELIESSLLASAPNSHIIALTIDGKSVQYKREDLLLMRNKYKWEVYNEKRVDMLAQGLDPGGRINIRFGGAS